MTGSACASEDELLALATGGANAALRARIEAHVAGCDDCRAALSALARLDPDSGREAPAEAVTMQATDPTPGSSATAASGDGWAPGTRVGRFVVRELLGSGGMGEVHAADDTELGRRVALKVLRRELGADTAAFEDRFKIEAAAMARTVHPAVVTLFDVGVHRGVVYLAMELVDGGTLARWLATPRPWAEVVRRFVAAGRGLAAAHAAGIVHRDFKPENVLLDRDGAPHVADFGVARSRSWGDDAPLVPISGRPSDASIAVTRTAALVGTPLYMSPEQLAGEPATPASDQFSFFVALYTALYGERPFSGGTIAELRAAVDAGLPARRATHGGAPGRLWPVIRRGLAVRPTDRFPTLAAALDALERAARPRWPRRALIAAGVTLAAVAAVAWWRAASTAPPDPCRGAGDSIAAVWGPTQRDGLAARFAQVDPTIGADTARRTGDGLDAYGERWRAMSLAACRAVRVAGEQSEADLALRTRCLDRRKRSLVALVTTLSEAERATVVRAVDAVGMLPSIDTCADLAALAAPVPPPDGADRARVDELETRLAAVEARHAAGDYPRGAELAEPVVAAAIELGYRPLEAEALVARARLRSELGDHAGERDDLDRAILAASAGHADQVGAGAAVELMITVGHRLGDPGAAAALDRAAGAAVERAGGGAELEAAITRARAILAFAQGDPDAAERGFRQLLERAERQHGANARELLPALRGLAAVAGQRMDGAALLAVNERILAVQRATVAADHPDIATTLASVGYAQYLAGQFAAAVTSYEDAIARRERYLGPDHADVAGLLGQLAPVYGFLGRTTDAIAASRRAVEVLRRALGDQHRRTLAAIISLAQMLETGGQVREARAELVVAIATMRAEAPGGHPLLASALTTLGLLELGLDAPVLALAALREADEHEARTRQPGGGSGELARLLGVAHLALGKPRDAVAPLERARRLLAAATAGGDDVQVVRADALLAEALVDSGADRARGRTLAVAIEVRMRAEPRLAGEHARLVAWMQRRRVPRAE
jgi:tetratricopeptide (TPR) repeat protein